MRSKVVKNPPKKRQKKCENEYSVVRFNDKKVKMFECIPDGWFVDKHRKSCYWPPKTGKAFLLRALSQEKPQGWKKYDCVVISSGHATYNSGYEIVKEKCAQKFNTSSADEEQEVLRHHRKHPVLGSTKAKSFENVFADTSKSKNQMSSVELQNKQEEDESADDMSRYRMASLSPVQSQKSLPASSNHARTDSKSPSSKTSKRLKSSNSHCKSSRNDLPSSTPRRRSISPSSNSSVSHSSRGSISKSRSRSRSSTRSRSPSHNVSVSNSLRGSISKSRSTSRTSTQRSRSPSRDGSGSVTRQSISSRNVQTSPNYSKSRIQGTREGSVPPYEPLRANTTRRSFSNSQRSNSLNSRIAAQTEKPKVLVAASGSIFKEIKDLQQSLKENNQRIAKNDRRLTRMEVTLNKVFVMMGDLRHAVNSNNTSKVGTSADANSNEIPRGFKVPDFPVDDMSQLIRLDRNLRDGEFCIFLLTQEKTYCAPSRQSDSVVMTAYLKRFITLDLRDKIHLVDAKGKDEPTLKHHFPEVFQFLSDVMISGYKEFKTQIKSTDAHIALRTVWGRTKQMLREQKNDFFQINLVECSK